MAGTAEEARAVPTRSRVSARQLLEREWLLGYAFLLPAVLYIVLLVGYPFFLAISFSVRNVTTGGVEGEFVRLDNFVAVTQTELFWVALRNSFVFTLGSEVIKGILGLGLAFLLLQPFRGRNIVRALVIIPWAMPIAVSAIAWRWMFDPLYSVINWVLVHAGLVRNFPQWLGEPQLAMWSVIIVNVWRGLPFSAIVLMAAITAVPQDLVDAAKVDGASFAQRWRLVMVPIIAPILFIALLFSLVFTFTDLSIVYLLTRGGPVNATQVLPTLAFQVGILSGALGRGAAIALFMLPVLMAVAIWLLRTLKRREDLA
ncbi:MAG TPA: sugar ABC transporter permease [Chloroflexota bacterium]